MGYLTAKKKCWDIIKKYYPVYEGKRPVIEAMIRNYIKKDDVILLDIGCGRGKETAINYKDEVNTSYGIDISEAIKLNDTIHYPVRADVCSGIPFVDSTFDMVIAQELIEHLKSHEIFFKEVSRILKPEGIFIFSTPNLLSWKSIISLITPYRLHIKLNKQLHGINRADVFPTYYRMNRVHKINRFMQKNGMQIDKIIMWEGTPQTLTFSRLTTYLDILVTTILCKYNIFKYYRELIIASYKKQ